MPTSTSARWNPPVKNLLVDLHGASEDIYDAREFCDLLITELAKQSRDISSFTIRDAVVTAMIVRYARAFGSGVRMPLDTNQNHRLTTSDITLHQRIIDIRNKHIAHPVSQMETDAIFVSFLIDNPDDAKATSVGAGSRRNLSLTHEEVLLFKDLCVKWHLHLIDVMNPIKEELLVEAQKLSSRELMDLPRGPTEPSSNPLLKRVRNA